MLTFTALSPQEQENLGGRLAAAIDCPCVIYLRGDLGAGKTTLVRGYLRALGYQGAVKSPTYTLVEPYEVAGQHLLHCDLYRLADPAELEYLGIRDALEGPTVLLVEWPEQGAGELPAADIEVLISYQGEGRQLRFEAHGRQGLSLLDKLARNPDEV
jgi:tRNA threonylcarbamoyladenosine biosynthesis protein TsaE